MYVCIYLFVITYFPKIRCDTTGLYNMRQKSINCTEVIVIWRLLQSQSCQWRLFFSIRTGTILTPQRIEILPTIAKCNNFIYLFIYSFVRSFISFSQIRLLVRKPNNYSVASTSSSVIITTKGTWSGSYDHLLNFGRPTLSIFGTARWRQARINSEIWM